MNLRSLLIIIMLSGLLAMIHEVFAARSQLVLRHCQSEFLCCRLTLRCVHVLSVSFRLACPGTVQQCFEYTCPFLLACPGVV